MKLFYRTINVYVCEFFPPFHPPLSSFYTVHEGISRLVGYANVVAITAALHNAAFYTITLIKHSNKVSVQIMSLYLSLFAIRYCYVCASLMCVSLLVCCKVMSFIDGTVQTKVDLIWESEPKYIGKN